MALGDTIRKRLISLGYAGNRKGRKVLPIALFVISVLLIANNCRYIFSNMKAKSESDTIKVNIVIALKDVDFILSEMAIILEYTLAKRRIETLMLLLDNRFSYYSDYRTDSHDVVVKLSQNKEKDTVYYMGFATWFVYYVVNALPGAVAAVVLFSSGSANTHFTDLPLPMTLDRPQRFDNATAYLLSYALLTTYLLYAFWHGNLALILLSTTPQKVTTDIKLFCVDLERINRILEGSNDKLKLRDYTNYLVRRHQGIQSSVRSVTECLSRIMCVFNQTMCFHMCVFLYCATDIHNKLVQAVATVCTLTSLTTLVLYCHTGQQLINEGEEIRRSLYFCEWLDKPMWFKKDLLLMTTMAYVPLQIKPLGLFVVDYRNVVKITNAAYSYFNLIRTLNK